MTLLAPWALWLSLIGLAVIALYLLKIKRVRQPVPSLEFWRELAGQTQVRSLFKQLKRWLSLLLWLIIVACLVMAIGNPLLSYGTIKARSIAVIVDNSASMQAVEDAEEGKTRLDLAMEAIENLTGRRPVSDEWLLIEAAREPRVLRSWTRDHLSICKAAAEIQSYGGSSDLKPAVDLAHQLSANKDEPVIVVITDGAAGEINELQDDDKNLLYWSIGQTNENVGITHFRVRQHWQQAAHYALVSAFNASSQKVESQIAFELDGSTVAVEPVEIESGATWQKTVSFNNPEGGVLKATLENDDDLTADNEAYAILEPIRSASVYLVTPAEESFFFEQALAAMDPIVDLQNSRTMTPDQFDSLSSTLPPADLVIFNNAVPSKSLKSGRFLHVNKWPTDIPARIIGTLEGPAMSLTQRDHPLTRYLNLGAVTLAKSHRVDLTGQATVVAQSANADPLIFLHERPDRQDLCLAFDVLESDMPFRNAFPVFLRNAVTYLLSEQSSWIRGEYGIGEAIEPLHSVPDDVTTVGVARPQADQLVQSSLPVINGRFTFNDTARSGPLRFDIGDDVSYTAVNLADSGESDIRVVKPTTAVGDRLTLSGRLAGFIPWFGLACAAVLLVSLEWLTYHFRWTE